jgi:Tfp pilus assembly protein PilW
MSPRLPVRIHARGLSLAELLLGLAIGALVLAPLPSLLQSAGAAARVAEDQAALEREADFALERIAARIRDTAPAAGLTDKPSSEWLKPAVYSVADGVLVEQQGKDSYVLAESVSGFDMSASSSEAGQPLVKVSLVLARGGASTTAVTTVRLGSAQ